MSARKSFYDKLSDLKKTSTDRSVLIDNERYEILLKEVNEAQLLKKNMQSLSSKQYRRLKRYDILKIGDTQKLIESGSEGTDNSNIRYFCNTNELFDILEAAHLIVGHKKTRGRYIFKYN